jgi:uncharacterized protein YgiM (DUF1202 family)
MSLSLVKTAAVAATLLVASASGAFASTYAIVDHDANVRSGHGLGSPVINSVDEGDYVKILDHWGNWYKVKTDFGPNGWVYYTALEFDYSPYPTYPAYPTNPNVQACFWGPLGYVCVNS